VPESKPRSFRFSAEALENLRELSERWGVSQARVLELLIEEAHRESKVLRVSSGMREKAQ
jgi:predicted DNA-binding protein